MSALLEMAIQKYSKEAQINVAIEECSELIKALCKMERGGLISAVAEEIADVEIMIEQLKIIFNCKTESMLFREDKLMRLAKSLNNADKVSE